LEQIEAEVDDNLTHYGIEGDELVAIRWEIRDTLAKHGVRFHNE
jgi:hypothetical protein